MRTDIMTRPMLWLHALLLVVLFAAVPARAEVKIQEVVSSSGVKAWLVEDYTVPIISIRFAFKGGSTQDPAGKEGLANLMTGLFDEGAGDLDSDAFQIRLDDAAAEMGFSASPDATYGSMRMLAEGQDEAFALLRMATTSPASFARSRGSRRISSRTASNAAPIAVSPAQWRARVSAWCSQVHARFAW